MINSGMKDNDKVRIGYPGDVDFLGLQFGQEFPVNTPFSLASRTFDTSHTLIPLDLDQGQQNEVWNPFRLFSRSYYNTLDQSAMKGLPCKHTYSKSSGQSSETRIYQRSYADSGYGSWTNGDTQSVISSSCALESAPSPSVASSYPNSRSEDAFTPKCQLDFSYKSARSEGVNTRKLPANESLTCDLCNWAGITPSEKKKHDARHRKPYQCEETGCPMGFGTKNDLERHRKTVHHKAPRCGPYEVFRCFGKGCNNPQKKWPRLDNFRAHIKRMHHQESEQLLIDLSRKWLEGVKETGLSTESPTCEAVEAPTVAVTEARSNPHNVMADSNIASDVRTPIENQTEGGIDSFLATEKPWLSPNIPLKTDENDGTLDKTLPRLRSVVDFHSNNVQEDTSNTESPQPEARTGILPGMKSFDWGVAAMKASVMKAFALEAQGTGEGAPQPATDAKARVTGMNETMDAKLPNISKLSKEESMLLFKIVSNMKSQLEPFVTDAASSPSKEDPKDQLISAQKGASQLEEYICSECSPNKKFKQGCQLRKHMVRHKKPYGCTFDGCYQKFGSKADWKRHENMQHFHPESFRCSLLSPGQHVECARLFRHEAEYRAHLEEDHEYISTEEIDCQVSKNRIGLNAQSQFWCGFCRKIRSLEKKGLEAWNERFDHIDNEHFKREERIEDWLPAYGHITKGNLKGGRQCGKSARKDQHSYSDTKHEVNSNSHGAFDSSLEECSFASEEDHYQQQESEHRDDSLSVSTEGLRKRKAEADSPEPSPKFQESGEADKIWFCCDCSDGPIACWQSSCPLCTKRKCEACKLETPHKTSAVTEHSDGAGSILPNADVLEWKSGFN